MDADSEGLRRKTVGEGSLPLEIRARESESRSDCGKTGYEPPPADRNEPGGSVSGLSEGSAEPRTEPVGTSSHRRLRVVGGCLLLSPSWRPRA